MWNRIEPLDDGIYLNYPEKEYHALDCFSYSMVPHILKSMKHLDKEMSKISSLDDKDYVRKGNMIECLMLEPDEFNNRFEILPETYEKVTRYKTKENKVETLKWHNGSKHCDEYCKNIKSKGKIPVSKKEFNDSVNAVEELKKHPIANRILSSGFSQVTVIWTDPKTGLKCKGRYDNFLDYPLLIADLKATVDASENAFQKKIGNMMYYVQGAVYQHAYDVLKGELPEIKFVAVEYNSPYGINIFPLREDSILQGLKKWHDGLSLYAEMIKLKPEEYRGYPIREIDIDIPSYMLDHRGIYDE